MKKIKYTILYCVCEITFLQSATVNNYGSGSTYGNKLRFLWFWFRFRNAVLMTKNGKNLLREKILSFPIKNCNLIIPRPP